MVLDSLLGTRSTSEGEKLLYLIDATSTDGVLLGRKKLTKLAFFAEHWLPDEDVLLPDCQFCGFDFALYAHGPFSKDLFRSFDELRDRGIVTETRRPQGRSEIRVTESGARRLASIERSLERTDTARLAAVRDRLSGLSGDELEALSLTYLGIEESETTEYMGMPIAVLVSEQN